MSNDIISNFPQQSFSLLIEGLNNNIDDVVLCKQRASELESICFQNKVSSKKNHLPLQRAIVDQKPYPFSALGPILGAAAQRIHEIVKAPDSICGQSVLAATSLATQAYGDVEIDGRVYPISIFALTIGESGDRKSAVDNIALFPIRNWEKMLVNTNREETRIYKNKLDAWKKKRQGIINNCSDNALESQLNNLEKEPTAPLEPYILLEEPTYEGLIKLLAIGQPSIGLFSDEGGRMIGGHAMSNDHLLKTACGLSSLWDGKPITRIRGKQDENLLLYGKRLSMHLMMQEIIFSKVQQNEMLFGQGLLARCLVTYALSNAGNRPYEEIDITKDPIIQKYWQCLSELLDQSFPLSNGHIQNELTPKKLILDSEAKKTWINFHNELDQSIKKDGPFRIIRRVVNKAAEQALRIAGILTIFQDKHAISIVKNTLERSITLTRYYLDEALRIMDLSFVDQDLELAQKVEEWMQKKTIKENNPIKNFQLQEIYQYGPREVRNKKITSKIMKILEDHGRVSPFMGDILCWQLSNHQKGG